MSLTVHDAAGRRVAQLVGGRLPAGLHRAEWDGRDEAGRPVASGVYVYRLRAGTGADERTASRKLLLLR